MKMVKVIILLCWLYFEFAITSGKNVNPTIAVVGGGIGGTSSAFFLRELFKEKAKITLFEHDSIGGRLNLLNIDGKYYESGGAVIHPRNKYMMDFLKKLGLTTRTPQDSKFGIFDGEKFVFRESAWSFVTMADFFWRYGFSATDIWKEVKSMLDEFSRIYKIQEDEYAFTTLYNLLDSMSPSFRNMTQETLSAHLLKKGLSELLQEEIVQSVMMVNYGQTNNISAFAGFVSLAGADSNLWSVEGGNKLIPEALLKESKAVAVNGDVTEVELLSDGTFLLKSKDMVTGELLNQEFDIVVIAAPFMKDTNNIKFKNFAKDFQQYEKNYQHIITTFVKGFLNPLAFNSPNVPEEILTFKPQMLFNSIGKVIPVSEDGRKEDGDVYKVFSKQHLTQKNIDIMFKNAEIVKEKEWLAYPHYEPPEQLPPFFLYPGLYYVNAVELAASAMEMSAIGAKNVALLAFNLWNNMVDKVDHHKRTFKDEL